MNITTDSVEIDGKHKMGVPSSVDYDRDSVDETPIKERKRSSSLISNLHQKSATRNRKISYGADSEKNGLKKGVITKSSLNGNRMDDDCHSANSFRKIEGSEIESRAIHASDYLTQEFEGNCESLLSPQKGEILYGNIAKCRDVHEVARMNCCNDERIDIDVEESASNHQGMDYKYVDEGSEDSMIPSNNHNHVDSPSAKTNEEMSRDSSDSKRWEDFVRKVDISTMPNIKLYVDTKEIRIEATNRFIDEVDKCFAILSGTTREILSDVFAPVCNEYSSFLEESEAQIIRMMTANHNHRHELIDSLENTNTQWKKTYARLMGDILGEIREDSSVEAGNEARSMSERGCDCLKVNDDSIEAVGGSTKSKQGASFFKEINWEEMSEFEPSRPRIETFFESRDHSNEALSEFGEEMDIAHAAFEHEENGIIEMVLTFFSHQNDPSLDFEDQIQRLVMDNYERRRYLREQIEHSARLAQERFAMLLSRLG